MALLLNVTHQIQTIILNIFNDEVITGGLKARTMLKKNVVS